jgi:hypothetical protein
MARPSPAPTVGISGGSRRGQWFAAMNDDYLFSLLRGFDQAGQPFLRHRNIDLHGSRAPP